MGIQNLALLFPGDDEIVVSQPWLFIVTDNGGGVISLQGEPPQMIVMGDSVELNGSFVLDQGSQYSLTSATGGSQ